MSAYRPSLSHLSHAYRAAETTERFAAIPDGVYKAQIISASVNTAQNGSLYVAWRLNVAKNKDETVHIQKSNFLTEGYAMANLKSDIKALGVDPDTLIPLDRLHDVLDYLVGASVEFEQRTTSKGNKTYINQNFTRLIRESGKKFPEWDEQDGFAEMGDDDGRLPWEE